MATKSRAVTVRRDDTPTTQRQPARGYSWPPFEKGNTLSVGNFGAVRHGAYSDRIITEKADHIRGLLLSSYPYLADETFSEAVLRYCRAEARAVLLHDYVMEKAETKGVEAVKPYLWSEVRGADALAQKCGSDCGLDPAGHAKIARDLGMAANIRGQQASIQIGSLQEQGRRLYELRGSNGK
jgi:hypothetical protein